MKKFVFKLQSLLDAREKVLEQCQLEMAKVQNKLYVENQTLENLYNAIKTLNINLEKIIEVGANIDFIKIKNYQDYISKVENDIKNQHKIIADIEIELEEKKNAVLEATKQKKMIEKLKENKHNQFLKELEYQDRIQIDEIATSRYKKIS